LLYMIWDVENKSWLEKWINKKGHLA
jgi:hypothetical protein